MYYIDKTTNVKIKINKKQAQYLFDQLYYFYKNDEQFELAAIRANSHFKGIQFPKKQININVNYVTNNKIKELLKK